MATLAFKAESQSSPYKCMFEEEQWEALVDLFYQELYRLNNLTPQSVLEIHLQVSMSQDVVQLSAVYATLSCNYRSVLSMLLYPATAASNVSQLLCQSRQASQH